MKTCRCNECMLGPCEATGEALTLHIQKTLPRDMVSMSNAAQPLCLCNFPDVLPIWREVVGSTAIDEAPPLETNARGGRAAAIDTRCDLLPPFAILKVAELIGANVGSHGVGNWRNLTPGEHINHGLRHTLAFLTGVEADGEDGEAHLTRAACRLLMALDILVGGDGLSLGERMAIEDEKNAKEQEQ